MWINQKNIVLLAILSENSFSKLVLIEREEWKFLNVIKLWLQNQLNSLFNRRYRLVPTRYFSNPERHGLAMIKSPGKIETLKIL